jgi:hypothetical protein
LRKGLDLVGEAGCGEDNDARRDCRQFQLGKTMSSKLVVAAAAALLASFGSQGVLAQASAPVSRAEVKAETKAAEKSGKLTPAGEAPAPVVNSTGVGPTTTRAERKAATLKARKEGTLQPAGPTQKADVAIQKAPPTTTRAARKAATVEARKEGTLVPAGEGSPSDVKK